ncbi:uncharacterized protein LOC110441583 [Mizuhopecten yessoensis]|uniref:Death domain-containing protein n=1 Tax=Mizuhopecten yessoensis TaxID=6573 RepID=A0A210PJ44_MIZYE|nr:uncharacterized protein LOC110441583 [Mizuhopecten yessoensis]XP_021340445.1 uncharacterized protein LOC110441583 [Mizuhopecten yessoensis]XP_021340446.1 uncharacterized protein LOC110441583 [Mizuhopecten yessoensis]OWF36511.1 hypothetical protein KP79_PYT03143 [Mizuhopecten yessoensis]
MPVTKGKLNAGDQSILDQNHTYLVEQLDATYVVDLFIDRGVFDLSDSENIRSKDTTEGRNRALLDTLYKAGPAAYGIFREILQKDYDFIVKKLDATKPNTTVNRSPGQILIDELTDDLKAHRMSELDLLYFSKSFSTAITSVAMALKINRTEVEQIQLSNQFGGAVNHNQSLLIKWKNRTGRAATLLALMEAFTTAEQFGGDMNWELVEDGIKRLKK